MITYENFKKLFDSLDSNRNPEIEFYLNESNSSYILIKYNDYISFGKTNTSDRIYQFINLDELYNTKIDNNFCLKHDWEKVNDILIDLTFSVVSDKDEIKKIYNIDLL